MLQPTFSIHFLCTSNKFFPSYIPFLFCKYKLYGKSVLGNPLYCIQLGTGKKEVCYSASIHANEWITSILLMKFIEEYANAYVASTTLYGYSVRDLFETTSIYILPMLNPDGVNLVNNVYTTNSFVYAQAKEIASHFPSIPFPSGWKSNITGESLINFHLYCEN